MKEEKISGNDRKEFERFAESLPAVCAKNANGERCGLLADKGAGNTPPLDAVGKCVTLADTCTGCRIGHRVPARTYLIYNALVCSMRDCAPLA